MEQPTPKRIVDIDRFQLFENLPGFEAKPGQPVPRSRLTFSVRDGYPRITVWINDPNINTSVDKQANMCTAPMDIFTFRVFLTLFEKIINNGVDDRNLIKCMSSVYEDGKPTNEKRLVGELHFGRKSGINWISVTAPGKPLIPFRLRLSEWHSIHHSDGTSFTEEESSNLVARNYLQQLRVVYENLAAMQSNRNAIIESQKQNFENNDSASIFQEKENRGQDQGLDFNL